MGSQQNFRDTLERRAKRLTHLLEMSAPPQMVGKEVALVVQAAMGYAPKETTEALGSWMVASVRRDAGYCVNCDEKFQQESSSQDYICPSCTEKHIEGDSDQSIKTYDSDSLL